MLKNGILNPHVNSLLSRVRHTNTLVIADRGFPFWTQIETVDISLTDDLPRVTDVLRAIRLNFVIGRIFLAEEFYRANSPQRSDEFLRALAGLTLSVEPHSALKQRVPEAVGLIRTGDTTQYANLIIESA